MNNKRFGINLLIWVCIMIGICIWGNARQAKIDHRYIKIKNIVYIHPREHGGYEVLVNNNGHIKQYTRVNANVVMDIKKGSSWLESTNFKNDCDILNYPYTTSTTIHIRNEKDIR